MRQLVCIGLVIGVNVLYGQQIEIAVQKGHSGDITAIAFNHDGKLLASAGSDHLIKLWHVPTGKEMASFNSASFQQIINLQFKGDNDFLLVQYDDGSVHTWDIANSALHSKAKPARAIIHDPINYMSRDSSFRIYIDRFYLRREQRPSGKVLFSKVPVDISKNFKTVAVSEDEAVIVTGNEDGKVYVYDLNKGKSLAILDGHYSVVNSVCFAPGGGMFATASADRSIIIWNTETRQQLKRLFGRSYRFEALAFNHAGTQLAVGDELGKGRIIDLRSSRVRVAVSSWHDQKVSSIAFSGDDSTLYSGGYDNRMVSFNLTKERVQNKSVYKHYVSTGDYVLKKLQAYREPFAWVNTVAVSPAGSRVAMGGGWRESSIRKQPQPLVIKNLVADETQKLSAHQGAIHDIHFLNEFNLLSAGEDGLVQWSLDAPSNEFYFRKKPIPGITIVQEIQPGPENTVLLRSDSTLLLYDIRTEQVIDSIKTNSYVTAATFNAKTNKVVYSLFNNLVFTDIRSWHTERLTISGAHSDRITGIDFNPAQPMIATVSWDATVKLWNADTGELQATIISIGSNDHLIITPDNYYYGTKNSLRGLGFKYGKQFVSPEQYDLHFNRPDIVLARLGFVPKEVIRSFQRAYHKRLQKMNFSEQMLSEEIHLPEASVVTSQLPLRTSTPEISFTVRAFDSKYMLDRINIFVNNIPVYGIQGIDLRSKQIQEIAYPVRLKLSQGKNKIQVSCLNEKGVESLLPTFEIEYKPVKAARPNLYVAVVSVSRYANSAMNLKYARKDGEDLVNMFRRAGWFERIIIDTLFDARATRENILRLRQRFEQSNVDDQIVFFISGHGLLDENLDFYFATHHIDFKSPASGGLRYDELEGLLDGIPARRKLLMMDACHSGEVDKSRIKATQTSNLLGKNQRGSITEYAYPVDVKEEHYKVGITTSFELMQELFANLSKGSGAVVISAAAGNSFALESDEWRNGVFTYALLSGIKSKAADQNRNGVITVSELKDFVSEEVEALTKGAQKPTSRRENLEFDFRVY